MGLKLEEHILWEKIDNYEYDKKHKTDNRAQKSPKSPKSQNSPKFQTLQTEQNEITTSSEQTEKSDQPRKLSVTESSLQSLQKLHKNITSKITQPISKSLNFQDSKQAASQTSPKSDDSEEKQH